MGYYLYGESNIAIGDSLLSVPFRRYRALRDETCGSFVYVRPQRRVSASGQCVPAIKKR